MFVLLTLTWLIAIVSSTIPAYWLIVHGRARHWARSGGKRLLKIGPVWLLLWGIAGAITWPWRLTTLYQLRWTWIPAAILILAGFALYGFASRSFSANQILGFPELQPQLHRQQLSTAGIRAHIRHPYYLGHFFELLGWSLGSGLVAAYGLALFGVLTGYFMIVAEERELEDRLGEQYGEYRRRTAAMFPGIW
jgi:protein-S-isoprenylcysteine O-methyltransferase Ste14